MASMHIAFVLEHAYGHIMPTLGIAIELVRRGHRVSYATTADFVPLVTRAGAKAVVITAMRTRARIIELCKESQAGGSDAYAVALSKIEELREQRTRYVVPQLEEHFRNERPDVVVHDSCEDVAGRVFADRRGIARVRFQPTLVRPQYVSLTTDRTVIVPVPKFFNEELDPSEQRFHLVGFIPEGRVDGSRRWCPPAPSRKIILASPTTGFLPQDHFCQLMMAAFQNAPYTVVLSVPEFDPWSAVDRATLGALPENFYVNTRFSNMEILPHCCLFVGQGGPGSTLEALYCGVPLLLLPAGLLHEVATNRVVELGLGRRLSLEEVSAALVRETAEGIIGDDVLQARVRAIQSAMVSTSGAERAADILEGELA